MTECWITSLDQWCHVLDFQLRYGLSNQQGDIDGQVGLRLSREARLILLHSGKIDHDFVRTGNDAGKYIQARVVRGCRANNVRRRVRQRYVGLRDDGLRLIVNSSA